MVIWTVSSLGYSERPWYARLSTCLAEDMGPHFSSEDRAWNIWSESKCAFSFSRNCQTVFKVFVSIFTRPPVASEVLVAPYFHQLLVGLSSLLILNIFMGVGPEEALGDTQQEIVGDGNSERCRESGRQ